MVDRDEHGRFKKGWTGGPGRPRREVEEQYLSATIARVPVEEWQKVIDKALTQAIAGDSEARKWLSDYLMGKPILRHEVAGENGGLLPIAIVKMDVDEL